MIERERERERERRGAIPEGLLTKGAKLGAEVPNLGPRCQTWDRGAKLGAEVYFVHPPQMSSR